MATFYDFFDACAERWPQNVCLEIQHEDKLESFTYAETRRMAESVGRWLGDQGYRDGARIAILAANHPRWVAVYLGVIAAGCTAVPLDTALNRDQVKKLLADSGTSLVFCDSKNLANAKFARGDSTRIVLIDKRATNGPASLDSIIAAGPGNFAAVSVAPDSVASLLYTSGTTADPKGVMLTQANLVAETEAVFDWLEIGPTDAVLGILPMFHVLAQMANLMLPLARGARVVYLQTLNTTELLRALQERGITAFAVVPQFFYLIHERIFKEAAKRGAITAGALKILMRINRALRKVSINVGGMFFGKVHQTFGKRMRYLITGGSRFDPAIGNDFYALGIDILQAYGLTESTGAACGTPLKENVIGSVGRPLKGLEARIADYESAEPGTTPSGEIALRGGLIMKGYWNRPDATEAVMKDGWFHTGDLGYFDSQGNLFITGRKKEVIVLSNGKNIYPEEIETHYLKSPAIKEICVLGIEGAPGDPSSERLHGVVVPDFEYLKRQKVVNAKEVIRFDIETLSAKLPSTKRVGSYEIWQTDLPRTTTRKLKRFEIEKQVKANLEKGSAGSAEVPSERPLSDEETTWLDIPEVSKAIKIIRDSSQNKPGTIRPVYNLELDLGFDSMQRIELLVALEEQLGGDVEESRLGEIYTVRELVDAVRESAAGGKKRESSAIVGWQTLLREQPTEPEVLAITKKRPIAEFLWFLLGRLVEVIAIDHFPLKVTGLENLPTQGPFILSSNHQSFLDPVLLAAVLPWNIFRITFAVGTSEIFGSGIMRTLGKLLRVISVDPDANLVPAMRAGAYGLRNGRVLILYPEGARSIDGSLQVFRKGVAILAIHMQAPVVPVAIDGFYRAWPRDKFFQGFVPLKMTFGKPMTPPPETEASEAGYQQFTDQLKNRIFDMWNQLREPPGKISSTASPPS
jgi:long-chain acyl-CoA synthetase